MNIFKKFAAVLILLLITGTNVFAQENGRLSYITSLNPETKMYETREETIRGEVDNSSLAVLVIAPITENEWVIIYEGLLSGYDNGYWNNIDFTKIDFLQILDSKFENPRYVFPLTGSETFDVNFKSDSNGDESDTAYNIMPASSGIFVSSQITINGIKVNEPGLRIIDDAILSCTLEVCNNSDSANELTAIFATYTASGKLHNVRSFKVDIEQGESENVEFTYRFDAKNEHTGKLMLWNSLSALTPVRASVDFSQTSGVNAYYYNSDNRLLQIDKISGVSLIYTYDNTGNLLTKTVRK